ncbi:hypothetical protein CERZMDRAFT_68681 [Cercospora zeae-maydis SCOH1-5]|uniref:TauD/TfdA-like domain-containing protein n=1 Tax=Cercospora zeae-maydis SCOH1-5 TaxID=717836 RepID=A0A6A6FDW5_9PEZI|nr:hypothetical protein CERZMDRAFT_68681 [Cercospora zeae-maydis SCOH1-5]
MSSPLFRQLVRTRGLCVSTSSWSPGVGVRGLTTATRLRDEHESVAAGPLNIRYVKNAAVRKADSAATGRPKQRKHKIRKPLSPKDISDRARAAPAVEIPLDGINVSLAPVALRDLCSCPLCVDTSTKQKLFYTPDIPSNIAAKTVSADSNSVTITWTNDVPGYNDEHVTEIPISTLRRIMETGKPEVDVPRIPRTLWDAATFTKDTTDFTYDEYMSDDTVLLKAVKQLQSHGLLFVTDVPEDEESVARLAERIGPLKTTFYGKTWDVRSVPDAKNVAYTAQNLGFHMDLMYLEQPPHLQLLHCIRSSSSGGASLFSDSFKAVQELGETDMESFATLSYLGVQFHYDHPGDHYYHQTRTVIEPQPFLGRAGCSVRHWQGASTAKQHFVSSVAWSPPFQGPFRLRVDRRTGDEADSPAETAARYGRFVTRWHKAASKFNAMIHREDHIHERLMKPGECVIFDNRRVLHARRAFDVGDVGKERWLKGAYIDKDPYLSKLKILQQKYDV